MGDWLVAVRESLQQHRALPHWCTKEQVSASSLSSMGYASIC